MRRKCARILLHLTVGSFVVCGLVQVAKQRPALVARVAENVGIETASTPAPTSPERTPITTDILSRIASSASPKTERNGLVPFPEYETLPYHMYLQSVEELQNATWVVILHDFVLTLDKSVSPHVNLVFSDYKHRMLVLNWIVAATVKLKPPLQNVLVVSLQRPLCDFLANSTYLTDTPKITCIIVPLDKVVSLKGGDSWVAAVMVRPVVIRLMNYWGYDVTNYDSDAVVLKNPQEVYERNPQDIVSSATAWPDFQAKPWGFTLCSGVILYRASPGTEMLWRSVSNGTIRDDQVSLNEGLQRLKIKWKKTTKVSQVCSTDGWEGEAGGRLKVFVLPERLICQGSCCSGNNPGWYVVHPGGTHGAIRLKSRALTRVKAWFIAVVTKESASPL